MEVYCIQNVHTNKGYHLSKRIQSDATKQIRLCFLVSAKVTKFIEFT